MDQTPASASAVAPVPAPAAAPAPAPQAVPETLSFDVREIFELYVRREYDEISRRFLTILTHFEQTSYATLGDRMQYLVNAFVKVFLDLFTQPDYTLSEPFIVPFIRLNLTISNLVAMSCFGTTDAHLEVLRNQEANFIKILTLYSARNAAIFDRQMIFEASPSTASIWYSAYGEIYRSGLVRPEVVKSLQEHYSFRPDRLSPMYQCQEVYYGSTYVDGECDQLVKPVVNRSVWSLASPAAGLKRSTPDFQRIAVLSSMWSSGHSVYRNYYHYLRELKGYHLTFYRLGTGGPEPETSLFQEVQTLDFVNGVLNPAPIRESNYGLIYYPDVGMSPQSIVLANLRLAPIQVCSPGHSVSTWGAYIDYYISGADVELPENPERNYSERLVLLPGCGVIHNKPRYERTGRTKQTSDFLINCSWYSQKVNHRFCKALQRIVQGAKKKIKLRLFVGISLYRQNDFVPFVKDLRNLLGDAAEVLFERTYPDYMATMEEGDLSIDSFHFGGCNTIADSLYIRKPTVTWEGDKWYNRIGSQMLRMAGLHELIATSEEQYVNLVLRLIHDDDYRAALQQKINQVDLEATVFSQQDSKYFQKAIDYLIENHDKLKSDPSRAAIRIER